jgi:hypothetical protein
MNSKLIDTPAQTLPEKGKVFNSIDEYEAHINDNIKDSLSVFINIINNSDIFNKISSLDDIKKELNIGINLETLLLELNQSNSALEQINETITKNFEEKGVKKIEKKRVHYYFSKENGTNLAVSEYLNPFEQKELSNDFIKPRFYAKKSEIECIKEKICEKIRIILKKKFRLAYEEGVENERWTKDGLEIQDKKKEKIEKKLHENMVKKRIVKNSIKRLYPKPEVREGINDQFYVDKINEYNYNGKYLTKKTNFQTLFKELKIQKKEDYKLDPLNDLRLTNDILKEYFDEKNNREKNSSKISINKKEDSGIFRRGDLLFEQKDLLITKSKMYIKVDRKDKYKDFKIFGEPIDNKSKFFD